MGPCPLGVRSWPHLRALRATHLHHALRQLETVCEEASPPSTADMGTLIYLLSKCTYGGRMEDELDTRTLETYLEAVCASASASEKEECGSLMLNSSTSIGEIPVESHEEMMRFIAKLPSDASHLVMAMSEANHIEKSEMEGKRLLEKLGALKGLNLEREGEGGHAAFQKKLQFLTKVLKRKVHKIS